MANACAKILIKSYRRLSREWLGGFAPQSKTRSRPKTCESWFQKFTQLIHYTLVGFGKIMIAQKISVMNYSKFGVETWSSVCGYSTYMYGLYLCFCSLWNIYLKKHWKYGWVVGNFMQPSMEYCLQIYLPLFLFLVVSDRMHVIDSLPLVWMLDGRVITCKS